MHMAWNDRTVIALGRYALIYRADITLLVVFFSELDICETIRVLSDQPHNVVIRARVYEQLLSSTL